ncbi:hypothetical protein JHK87_035530 [Glycine soja]|nr:hypothetical protein JHK87_035530 [Glycine soja]
MATETTSLAETMTTRARGNKSQGECSKNDNVHFAVEGCNATIVESPKTKDDCGKLSNATRVLNRNHFGFSAYCVATIEFSRRQIPIAFLQRINEDFTKKYVGGKAATTATQSLNREFGLLTVGQKLSF